MKYTYKNIAIVATSIMLFASCSDFLGTKSPSYDSSVIFTSEAGLKQGVVGVYYYSYLDDNVLINSLHRPAVVTVDNFTGLSCERAQNTTIGAGGGMTSDQANTGMFWSANWKIISRANTVLHGAKSAIEDMSEEAKRYYMEAKILRAYAYYNLTVAFGDIPIFTKPVTVEEYTCSRNPRKEVLDWIIDELKTISDSNLLPWIGESRGHVDRSCACGLLTRVALFAAGVLDSTNASSYYKIAADYSKKCIDNSNRNLATNFTDLFCRSGQKKADVRKEIIWELMYSNAEVNDQFKRHWVALGNGPRMFAQTGQHPTGLLADTYECIDGLRIDESPLYNPQRPWENRDPRFHYSLAMHGDTLSYYSLTEGNCKVILEAYSSRTKLYNNKLGRWLPTPNQDLTDANAWTSFVKNGCGYIWRKYLDGLDQSTDNVTSSVIVMRYPEILLSYAEAKIELGEMDESVYNAINKIRNRVGMPNIATSRYNNADKMRQIVRRERKVELAMEGLHFADMRRWKIGDLENAAPSYGTPNAEYKFEGMSASDIPNFKISTRSDLNDIANYNTYKEKLLVRDTERHWEEKFYLWPLPQSELSKNPNLKQNHGYGD